LPAAADAIAGKPPHEAPDAEAGGLWQPGHVNERLAALLPYPRSVRPGRGWFELTVQTAVRAGPGAAAAAAAVRRVLGRLPWPDAGDSEAAGGQVTVDLDPGLAGEAYRLQIGPGGVRISAGTAAGAFYAAQTMKQLLPDEAWRAAPAPGPAVAASGTARAAGGSAWAVPCADIEDAPALVWRGAHLDVARHFFGKRELLAVIDVLAAHKLNRFHLHLTDDQGWRIESRLHPALHEIGSHRPRTRLSLDGEPPGYDETPHGGYYTLADLAELSRYAAQRMITVVPEIEVPGHASALLAALPELGAGPAGEYRVETGWGIFPNLMSPLPPTLAFLGEVFGELLRATGAEVVHIGGDECVLDSWRDDPRVDGYRRELGLASAEQLHAWFLRQVADLLADEHGARAAVWDEGFASGSGGNGTAGALRPDTIVMAWRGMDIARRAALAGHDVVAAPVLPTYFDYYQEDDDAEPAAVGGPVRVQDVAAFQPLPRGWPEQAARHLIGTQFQLWTEYIREQRALEYMMFPRACALAEVAWSGKAAAWGALRPRLAAQLRRLDAAGIDYRPLDGPRPWQRGGSGPRRHRAGHRITEVAAHLDRLAAGREQ
jgi:hexosaminidase